MADAAQLTPNLIARIPTLSTAQLEEVATFVERLHERERDKALAKVLMLASQDKFAAAWSDEDDGLYDGL